jgi:hypothetical protein
MFTRKYRMICQLEAWRPKSKLSISQREINAFTVDEISKEIV